MRGRKKPTPTPTPSSLQGARCTACEHVWVLRTPRLGRCPGCLKIGTAERINFVVDESTAA
jgi:hypothetical protein